MAIPAVLLVVEDDRDMRSLLYDELRNEGYQIMEADDGHEALMAVLKTVPDLIVTDLNMLGGGLDYIKRLRTSCPKCPIILMTGFGDTRTKDEGLRSGATVYFPKPVRMSQLKTTISELLRSRRKHVEGT